MPTKKPLYVKDTGKLKKYRSIDKINTTTLSHLAPVAKETADRTLDVLAGVLYLGGATSYINFSETNVDLGPSGSHELSAITSGFYAKVLITVDETGTVFKRQGAENAVEGSTVVPDFPLKELPVAIVTVRSNGASAGEIEFITQEDILDIRPHVSLFNSEVQHDLVKELRVTTKLDGNLDFTTEATINPGTFYGKYNELYRFTGTDIDLGNGGSHEVSAFTPATTGYFNKVFVYVNSSGAIETYEGTAGATAGTVVEPELISYDPASGDNLIPLAVITVQNDGTPSVGGAIEPIGDDDIEDIRPFFEDTGDVSSVNQNEFTASGAITKYDVVSLNSNGTVSKAKALTPVKPALAAAISDVADGNKLKFLTFGEMENSAWSWTNIGGKIYLSPSVEGGLTEDEPERSTTVGENFIQPVGNILSATKIFFTFDEDTLVNTL